MCGIAGYFSPGTSAPDHAAVVTAMCERIAYRGPDSHGQWWDADAGVALGHRRLAIIDLTPAGHQPMASASSRYMLVFNGEIYNHLQLRDQLQAQGKAPGAWRGHSDTETLLAGFDAWGIEATLQRAVGMFAIAVWDRAQSELTLCRDRLGEKPLYYGWQGHGEARAFLFGSELPALAAHPAFEARIDRDALCLFMRHNCIGGTESIYAGVHKLAPGSIATLSARSPQPQVRTYWSLPQVALQGVADPFRGSDAEAVDQLDTLLRDAIGQQMMSDVPLGAFLSGGIDSSTVVALMQAQSSRPVKTFSIGFHEDAYNEAEHAKAVARHLGTEHTELYVTHQQALDLIPRLPSIYAEPFADSSQIPTLLVSQLARSEVTVSLSGDAGDELFCGYNRYTMTEGTWRKLKRIPVGMRRMGARMITSVSPSTWNQLATFVPHVQVGDKLHKAAGVLGSRSVDELHRGLISHCREPQSMVIGAQEPPTLATLAAPELQAVGAVERMMALDAVGYLPDDILVKVDRAAMSVSLETRVPFLDHRVVEFAWRLPLQLKLRKGISKWPLRQVLHRYVPSSLVERPKMGFGVPIGRWLRGPLRDWAEDLLSEQRLRREGFLEPAPIRKLWQEHLSGQRNWQYQIWDVLMWQAWLAQHSAQGLR